MNKKANHYTLMFIPENNGKTFTLRVHKYIVRSLLTFFIIFVLCLSMLIYKSGEIAAKLQLLYIIRIENEKLLTENKQLKQITSKLDRIEMMSNYLNKLANPVIVGAYKSKIDTSANAVEFTDSMQIDTGGSDVQQNSPNVAIGKESVNSIPNILPVDGWITRQYNKDSSQEKHQGIDFAATLGSPIKATAPGVIEDIQNDPNLGILIVINHENGFVSKYGHCLQVLIGKHDRIKRGQTIALVGNTGRSTAPHLHYELLKDGVNIDPMKYLLTYK